MMVCCRVRPPLSGEIGHHVNLRPALQIDSDTNVVAWLPPSSKLSRTPEKAKRKSFQMDHVFGPDSSQENVFGKVMLPLLHSVMLGINSCLIAYGQTGAGKTFTTFGPAVPEEHSRILNSQNTKSKEMMTNSSFGLIPRAAQNLFDELDAKVDRARTKSTDKFSYAVHVTYYQIYLDSHIQDLLFPSKSNLAVKRVEGSDGFWSHQVEGLTEHRVTSVSQVLNLLAKGDRNKVVSHTSMNSKSSRSHSVFSIQLTQHEGSKTIAYDPDDGENKWGIGINRTLKAKLTCVDLAGSERASKTHPEGLQLEEAKSINRSLSALGNVIAALSGNGGDDVASTKSDPDNFVPWRDSKLTRLLQDSLSGRSKVSLIINIGPDASNVNESINSLLFGRRSMSVSLQATPNITVDQRFLAEQLNLALENTKSDCEKRIFELEKKLKWRQAEIERLAVAVLSAETLNTQLTSQTNSLGSGLKLKNKEFDELKEKYSLLEDALLEQLELADTKPQVVDTLVQCEKGMNDSMINMERQFEEKLLRQEDEIFLLRKQAEGEQYQRDEMKVEIILLQETKNIANFSHARQLELYERLLMRHHDKSHDPLTETAALKSKLKIVTGEKKKLLKTLQLTTTQYNSERNSMETRLSSFQEELNLSRAITTTMSADLKQKNDEVQVLKNQLVLAQTTLEDVYGSLSNKEAVIKSMQMDMKLMLDKFSNLEEVSTKRQERIQNQNAELEETVRKLSGLLDIKSTELESGLNDSESQNATNSELKFQNKKLADAMSAVVSRLDSADMKLAAMHELREEERRLYEKVMTLTNEGNRESDDIHLNDLSSPRVKSALQRSRLALGRALDAISEANEQL